MTREVVVAVYFLLANIVGFALMGIDKQKAKRHAWRISEANLLLTALFGGSIGAWAGMYLFHHKTKHLKFVIGIPFIIALQLGVTYFFFVK